MRIGNCPNCGAEVQFHSAAAAEVVCRFCHSILLARDASLEKIGLAADLAPSGSLIQIGAGGVWRDKPFTVVGRVVYESDQGSSSDWHAVFEDGSSGWIPDAHQLYAVVFPSAAPEPLQTPSDPEQLPVFQWHGTHYYMTALRRVRRTGREGELPCEDRTAVDLMRATLLDANGRTGVILFGGPEPQLYLGETAEFEDLQFTNLRRPEDVPGKPVGAEALNCPRCGGVLTLRTGGRALSLSCPHCLSLFDATRPELTPLRKFEQAQRIRPLVPLGTWGKIGGKEYEVVGFQARTTALSGGALVYEWHQYVLFHPQHGFRFLTQANGHWGVGKFLRAHPDAVNGVHPGAIAFGCPYRHFSVADAETVFVQGEFPWRLVVDEAAHVNDYIRPPFQLTCDSTAHQTVWFRSEYRAGREIWDAFALEGSPPPAEGIGPNQPGRAGNLNRAWTFGILLLLSLLVGGLACDTFLVSPPGIYWPASFLVLIPAAILHARISTFERKRWQRSDYDPKNASFRQVSAGPYVLPESRG